MQLQMFSLRVDFPVTRHGKIIANCNRDQEMIGLSELFVSFISFSELWPANAIYLPLERQQQEDFLMNRYFYDSSLKLNWKL